MLRLLLLVSLALALYAQLAAGATLTRVLTAENTDARLTPQPPIQFTSNFQQNAPTLSLYPSQRFQSILGFGAAFTEASSYNIAQLPASLQADVIRAYFNKSTGHGYNWGRIPMGSCDFSLSSYSYDDTEDDFTLKNFDTKAMRDSQPSGIIPLIHRAFQEANETLRLFGTPWSPPYWMKSNHNMNGTTRPCFKEDAQDRYHAAWALYFLKWIQTYESFGVPMWGMTIQNEPEAAQAFESCLLSPSDEITFLSNHLYPTVHPVYPDLKIMFWDHNKDHAQAWAAAFYTNSSVRDMVWGIALHWYSGNSFDNIQQVYEAYRDYDKGMMATEACNCPVRPNSWSNGELYGIDILGDLNAGVQGWTDWNMVLDWTGGPNHIRGESCDAPVIRFENNTVLYQPSYYYMGHFSRFLPRGAIRIMHQFTDAAVDLGITTWLVDVSPTSPDSGLKESVRRREQETGVKASGSEVVVILLNVDAAARSVQVTTGLYAEGAQQAMVQVPAHSIQTLHFDATLINSTAPALGPSVKTTLLKMAME